MTPIAVVVGAGGRIGGAIARHLVARGYDVHGAGRAEMDVSSADDVRHYFSGFRRIDVLVNAAGGYGAVGRVRDVAPWVWSAAIELNLLGVYSCCHHALRALVPHGHIINLAGGGRGAMEMRSGYAAAKSALWRLTETLAAEEPLLHVNAIAPGPMFSRMQEAVVGLEAPWAEQMRELRRGHGEVPVENTLRTVDHILEACPTGRLLFAREFGARPALSVVK